MPVPRFTRQHFAMYRGYLDGLSDDVLHRSWGESGTDVRITRRTIITLRDALRAVARRVGDTDAAHLLRLAPGSLPELDGAKPPPLEAWRNITDPDGVFSESELLALYGKAFANPATPPDRRIARNARLRERQSAALARMECAIAEEPAPTHRIDGWFAPELATRLTAAGLQTLDDLLDLIQRRRHRWYVSVPRLGPKGAQRITDWLALHASSLRTLSPLAVTPRRQLPPEHPALQRPPVMADVAPLEVLRVPQALDGSQGLNRAPTPKHQAGLNSDLDAINLWISTRGARSEHTARAYRREAERLLLWAILVREKPFSSLNTEDCRTYINEFLANPTPAARWIGNGRVERFDPAWRPFARPLSARSRETARSLLSALCGWLVNEQYLLVNPFHGLVRTDDIRPPMDAKGRTLSHGQWRFVLQSVSCVNPDAAAQRDYFALLFAYATGLRRAELATATVGALSRKALDGELGDAWTLTVNGKGARRRDVPMPARLMEALTETLLLRPTPLTLETAPRDTPLIGHIKSGRALTPNALARLYKRIFMRAAETLSATYPGTAADLMQASTHWLRHTHANHSLDAGTDVRDVQAGLGHASLATTTIYTKKNAARQYRSVEAFFEASLDQAR
ncbi:phage integrase family protein (plasmid) [Robbsia andropogonis]|uniref:phage integrase family protein n=1 Tax=Robbsia andropogonis TaxID=28092 RepID=UPI003D1FBFE8